jgi:hypothetical protein
MMMMRGGAVGGSFVPFVFRSLLAENLPESNNTATRYSTLRGASICNFGQRKASVWFLLLLEKKLKQNIQHCRAASAGHATAPQFVFLMRT